MHARRERRLDYTFRLTCEVCDHTTYHWLGGETREAADHGGPVSVACYGRCGGAETVHEVVRG